MKKQKILYLPIEVKPREFESRLLLGYEAVRKDYLVVIGSYSSVLRKALEIKDGIWLDKCISSTKLKVFEKLKSSNVAITSIDEEGLSHENFESSFKIDRFSKESCRLVSKVFCWGKKDHEKISSMFPEYNDKFAITGNPRIDLCSPRLSDYTNTIHSEDIQGNYVLFTGNFNVNNANGFGFCDEQMKAYRLFENQSFADDFNFRKKYRYRTFLRFSLDIEKLISQNKNIKFIYRPHPSENIDFWSDFLGSYSNCKVIYDDNYYFWLRNASVVIHSSCTSGLSSYFMQIPCISYLPYPDDPYSKFIANAVSYQAHNYEQLENLLNEILISDKNRNMQISEDDQHYLREMICNYPDFESTYNILREIDKLTGDKVSENVRKKLAKVNNNEVFSQILRLLQKFKNRFLNSTQGNLFLHDQQLKYSNIYGQQTFSGLSLEEIENKFSILKKVKGDISSYIIKISNANFLIGLNQPDR